jgi:hypothetical protein
MYESGVRVPPGYRYTEAIELLWQGKREEAISSVQSQRTFPNGEWAQRESESIVDALAAKFGPERKRTEGTAGQPDEETTGSTARRIT